MDFTSSMIGTIREESNSLICKEFEKGNSNFIKALKLPEVDLLVCNFQYGTGINKFDEKFVSVIEKKLMAIDSEINNLCKVEFKDGKPTTEQMIYVSMNADFENEEELYDIATIISKKIVETEYIFVNDFLVDVINQRIVNFR